MVPASPSHCAPRAAVEPRAPVKNRRTRVGRPMYPGNLLARKHTVLFGRPRRNDRPGLCLGTAALPELFGVMNPGGGDCCCQFQHQRGMSHHVH